GTFPTQSMPVETGDFDGDGNVDLAWVQRATPSLITIGDVFWVAFGNGDGTIQTPMQVSMGSPIPSISLTSAGILKVADLDRDGRDDVVVTAGAAEFRVFYGNANRSFSPPLRLVPGASLAANTFAVADITGDGFPDILFQDAIPIINNQYYGRFRLLQ